MAQSPSIRPLPPAVAAQLTSAAAIVSLNGVVVELLKNSLDAGAASIDVTVDHGRGGCTIDDDGAGIPPHDFTANGHLFKPYCTSKHNAGHAVLGCSGTFLASLAAVCLVTLTSRHVDYRSHNTLTIHHSTVLSRQLPTAATNEIRGQHGTRVTVHNLFGNLPVRVKQRQLLAGQNPDHQRQWQQLKRDVVAVLLAWERPFSLKIRDSHHRVIVRFKTPVLTVPPMTQGLEPRTVRPSKHLNRILGILTQAGYIAANDSTSWVPASATTSTLVVKGAISLVPAPSKAVQFISIETRPLLPTGEHHELYNQVNHLFKSSRFGDMDTDSTAADRSHSLDSESSSFEHVSRNQQHQNARKPADRHPMFFLHVFFKSTPSLNQSEIGCIDQPVDVVRVFEVVSAMISQWLERHHFRSGRPGETSPAKVRAANPLLPDMVLPASVYKSDSSHTPSTRATDSKPPRGQNSANLSRMRSSQTNHLCDDYHFLRSTLPLQPNLVYHGLVPAGTLLPNSALTNHDTDNGPLTAKHDEVGDSLLYWSHPQASGKSYTFNARTGCMIPYNKERNIKGDPATLISASNVAPKLLLSPSQAKEPVPTSWLGELLEHWQNPVFHASEANIRGLVHDQQETEVLNRHFPRYCCDDLGTTDPVGRSPHMVTSRLSKNDLQNAELISQVDRKFILVKIPSLWTSNTTPASPSSRLFLIDQHAADERIRVEKLLQELCCPSQEQETCRPQSKLGHRAGTESTALDVPKRFSVSQQECGLFVTFAPRFASWGILYDILDRSMSDADTVSRTELPTLLVTHLPPSILERCKADPFVLIELLRSMVWTYSSDTGSRFEEHDHVTTTNWVRRLAVIPPALFDMINSRACRTAIMFNDRLSTKQCKSLVQELSKCTFPFTCAHGRPSLVPLVELSTVDQSERLGAIRGSTSKDFVEAWKAHRASVIPIDRRTQ